MDLIEAVTLDEVIPVGLVRAESKQAHGSVEVRVQFIVNQGPAYVHHQASNGVFHADILDRIGAWLLSLCRHAQVE